MVEAHKNANEISAKDMEWFDTIPYVKYVWSSLFPSLLGSFSHERASPDLTSISCSVVAELLVPQIYISALLRQNLTCLSLGHEW